MWLSSDQFSNAITKSFGIQNSSETVDGLKQTLLNQEPNQAPRLVQIDSATLQQHWGAFSPDTNTIYLSQDLESSSDLAETVMAHELGHWVDTQLHGGNGSHAAVSVFAATLTGQSTDAAPQIDHSQGAQSIKKLSLPDGQEVRAHFFDTTTHVDWIPLLPNLSSNAKSLLSQAQNETDAFNSGSRTYGLQTNSASHFDNNNITGGLTAVRARYADALKNFNNTTTIPLVNADPYTGGNNRSDATPNPAFSGEDAGIQLLMYRFGQICHTLEDFYSHSNWVELANNGILSKTRLILEGNELPDVLKAGEFIPGTDVIVAQSGPNWSQYLQKSGTGTYTFTKADVYFNVNSDLNYFDPKGQGGVISATTLDGKTIYGLASGSVSTLIYKDNDNSVYLRDPRKTGFFESEYFRGLGHGGIAGEGSGQRVTNVAKDNNSTPTSRYQTAQTLAQLQVKNEWNRLGNLIFQTYGISGLERFAAYAIDTPAARQQYVSRFSSPTTNLGSTTSTALANNSLLEVNIVAESPSRLSTMTFDKSVTLGGSPVQGSSQSLDAQSTVEVPPGMRDWLASVDSNLYMTDIGITQTHNSMAYKGPSQDNLFTRGSYLNQEGYNLLDQFNGGVRSFSLLTSTESVTDRTTFRFEHNGYEVGDDSDVAFRQLFTALAYNPSEFIAFNIEPYGGGDGAKKFNSKNILENKVPIGFWNTTPGKRIHSFFFQDGTALQGTPKVWDDAVFQQWVPDLPEEKRALLRGNPLFYVPSAGKDRPTIPKLKDLRGKFVLSSETWSGRPFVSSDTGIIQMDDKVMGQDGKYDYISQFYLSRYYPDYAKDFPNGIYYDRNQFRRDEAFDAKHGHANPATTRSDIAIFIDNLVKNKPQHMPSWLGAYEGNAANLVPILSTLGAIGSGVYNAHNNIWNRGDNKSPSVADIILKGGADGGRIEKPKVGTLDGIFFTDFGGMPSQISGTSLGKSPASIIAEVQPRVEAIVTGDNVADRSIGSANGYFEVEVRDNRPGAEYNNIDNGQNRYVVLVTNLSKTLNQAPIQYQYGKVLGSTGSSLLIADSGAGKVGIRVVKGDKATTEYISIQVKDLRTGILFGAPRIYSLPPTQSPSIPPIRQVLMFGDVVASQSLKSLEVVEDGQLNAESINGGQAPSFLSTYGYQYFDGNLGKWLDSNIDTLSIHNEVNESQAILLQTPRKIQHLDLGQRAVWIGDGTTSLGHQSQTYYIESENSSATVYLNDIDVVHDRFVFVDTSGKQTVLSDELYQPHKSENLIEYLKSQNVYISFRPVTAYAAEAMSFDRSQLAAPLKIEASQFAHDVQGASLYFSAYDGSIPFLTLSNGQLLSTAVDPKYFGKAYSANVDISNGSSTSRNAIITISLDPKLTIGSDIFSSNQKFSVLINPILQNATLYSRLAYGDLSLGKYIPIASSLGLSRRSLSGSIGNSFEVGLGGLIDSGSPEFWLDDASGAMKKLEITRQAEGRYTLTLESHVIAQIQANGSQNNIPSISTVSCNDHLHDGLGFDLAHTNINTGIKSDKSAWNVTMNLDLYDQSSYSNTVGFYLFDEQCGSIVDSITGNRYEHNQSSWSSDVERFGVWQGSPNRNSSSRLSASFQMNALIDPDTVVLMPFIKVNDGAGSTFYSSFDSLNADGATHVKQLSRTTFGFEESQASGISQDFNDVILNVRSLSLA